MITIKVYYIENTNALDNTLGIISHNYPSAIRRSYVEMNYSCIEITARAIDLASIEHILAPLIQQWCLIQIMLCNVIEQKEDDTMIIAVSGTIKNNLNGQNQTQYQRKYYQPQTKLELKENVKADFDSMLKTKMSKLKINVII